MKVMPQENELICEVARLLHNIDLSGYNAAFLNRRLELIISRKGFKNSRQLMHEIVNNTAFALELETALTVNTTSMFRDPEFYVSLLRTINNKWQPNDEHRIWHAGCSSGEEMFSLAILLKENNLLNNCVQYGTDISHEALQTARGGSFKVSQFTKAAKNYRESGGQYSLKEYTSICYDQIMLDPQLKKRFIFSYHHLGNDKVFQTFDLILCRNLFIYYDFTYQQKMLKVLQEALLPTGLLCMGSCEAITFIDPEGVFECIDKKQHIYRKKAVL
jgi:chemotaxis protein methyltransferase CheR